MMNNDFTATISEKSTRYQEWLDVLGTDVIPIIGPVATLGSAPGIDEAWFFHMDLSALDIEQRGRLILHIARKFNVDEQEVIDTLDEVGCPILDEDVTLTIHNPQKWM